MLELRWLSDGITKVLQYKNTEDVEWKDVSTTVILKSDFLDDDFNDLQSLIDKMKTKLNEKE